MYATLEMLAVPAIPLTMTAGAIFGPFAGTAIVSASATVRGVMRDKASCSTVQHQGHAPCRTLAQDAAVGPGWVAFVWWGRGTSLRPMHLQHSVVFCAPAVEFA